MQRSGWSCGNTRELINLLFKNSPSDSSASQSQSQSQSQSLPYSEDCESLVIWPLVDLLYHTLPWLALFPPAGSLCPRKWQVCFFFWAVHFVEIVFGSPGHFSHTSRVGYLFSHCPPSHIGMYASCRQFCLFCSIQCVQGLDVWHTLVDTQHPFVSCLFA